MPVYQLAINVISKFDGKGTDDAKKKIEGLVSSAKNLGAGLVAAGATFKQAFDLAQEGAQINQLTESFDLMNESVFKTPDLLDRMTEAARGTVGEADLMAGILKLTAGASDDLAKRLAEASPQLLEISKASNKLNPTLGDTAFLYDSIATGIKRASPLILDNLGIVVKVGEANKTYADQLGKTVDALTAEEKQIALLNATLEAGNQLISQAGGSIDSQADAYARLTVKVESATGAFKQFLGEGLLPVVQVAAGDYVKETEKLIEQNVQAAQSTGDYRTELDKLVASYERSRSGFGLITGLGDELKEGIEQLAVAAASGAQTAEELDAQLRSAFGDENVEQITDGVIAIQGVQFVIGELIDQTKIYAAEQTGVNDSIATYATSVSNIANDVAAYAAEQDALAQATKRTDEASKELARGGIPAVTDEMREAREAAAKLAAEQGSIFKAFLDGEEGVSLFNESVEKLGEQYVLIGGRTAEQSSDLAALRDAYDKAAENLRDYELGIKGLNLEEDKRGEKMAEQIAIMEALSPKIAELEAVTGTASQTYVEATINQEALNNELFRSAQEAGASAEQLALLAAGLGLYDEAAIQAALQTALLQTKIDELAAQYAAGDISIEGMNKELQNFVGELQTADQNVNTVNESISQIPAKIESRVDIDTSAAESKMNSLLSKLGEFFSGFGAASSAANSAPSGAKPPPKGADGNFATGVRDFIVPSGFPNDSFLAGLTSGERVTVETPAQQRMNDRGGSVMFVDRSVHNYRSREAAAIGMAQREVERERRINGYMDA